MKRLVIALSLFLYSAIGFSQPPGADSLLNIMNMKLAELSDIEAADLYYKLAHRYYTYDLSKAEEFSALGLSVAEKGKNRFMESKFHEMYARIRIAERDFARMEVHLDKAMKIAVQIREPELQAFAHAGYGSFYWQQNRFADALEHMVGALSIYESTGNKTQEMITLGNIGSLHRTLNNMDKAIEHLERSKELAVEVGHANGLTKALMDLGAAYYDMGEMDKALDHELRALELCREQGNKPFESGVLQVLTMIYSEGYNDFESALESARECLSVAEELGYIQGQKGAYMVMSNIYRSREMYPESRETALAAYALDTALVEVGVDILRNLTIAEIEMGNQKQAIEYFKQLEKFTNEYLDEQYRQAVLEIEAKYQTEKKEASIAALEKEKALYIWLGAAGTVILLLLLGLLLFRHRNNLQERKIAEHKIVRLGQEKELIAAQSLLEGETAERTRLSRDLHDGLGGMLSAIKLNLAKASDSETGTAPGNLSKASEILDASISELRRIAHHLMPDALARNGLRTSLEDFCALVPDVSFRYIGDDTRLEGNLEILIYRCAYELINNAIKHSGAKMINVQLLVAETLVSLSVSDNGTGMDITEGQRGTGLESIRERVSAYNGKINIYSSPGKGTEVTIEIEKG